jgi:hypothetical protein
MSVFDSSEAIDSLQVERKIRVAEAIYRQDELA